MRAPRPGRRATGIAPARSRESASARVAAVQSQSKSSPAHHRDPGASDGAAPRVRAKSADIACLFGPTREKGAPSVVSQIEHGMMTSSGSLSGDQKV